MLSNEYLPLFLWGAFCALALAAVMHEIFAQQNPFAQSLALKAHEYLRRLQREFIFLRLGITLRQWVSLHLAAAVVFLFLSPLYPLVAGAASLLLFAPAVWLKRARNRRVAALETQVEGWMGALSRSLEAAPSLGEALVATANNSPTPLRDELELACKEMQLGQPLTRALKEMELRVQSRVLSMALATLFVGRQTGGALPQVLKDAASSLREMARLEGVLRSKTAEARAQSLVVSMMPLPIILVMNWVDPAHFDPLINSPVGHLLIGLAAVLWLVAIFCARKILAVRM